MWRITGMHSIRTKITAAATVAIIITMIIATIFGVTAIRNLGISSSERLLLLLCEAGQKNLDSYLEDVKQEVETISAYVEADLKGLSDQELQAHLDRASDFCKKVINGTTGIKTYYYRIDPGVSSDVKGFWYVNLDGEGFQEYEVTDITKYDTDDTSQLVWFTVPKATGKPVWLPPYITDNLDERVISYNTPVYYEGKFVGVIGIELDYSFMADLVNNITLFENGYAYISDKDGYIVFHPRMDVPALETRPEIPEGFVSKDTITHYSYNGMEKMAAWLPLINGDHLNVSVPVKEISASWHRWIINLIIAFGILLAAFVFFFMRFTRRITKPLQDLKEVAEQIDEGNYECKLDYKGDDEIGVLTRTFSRVTSNLKKYITDLNDLAYADALTSLHNKGAFDICINNVQSQLDESDRRLEFAVCIFDCNSLKQVNDRNGHDKGDIYLKETAEIICEVYEHSPVFRIGGDEFAALLVDSDYRNRDELLRLFDEKCFEKRSRETDAWEKVDVARGMAVYDPGEDESVNDVVRRADKIMYEDKWEHKHGRQERSSGSPEDDERGTN